MKPELSEQFFEKYS